MLWLSFSDGTSGTVDLSDRLVGPVLSALRDPREFARVRLGAETIEWPNGADWAPETLHEQVAAANGTAVQGNHDMSSTAPTHRGRDARAAAPGCACSP